MTLFMGILWLATGILMLLVAGMRPRSTELSKFELERRADGGSEDAKTILIQESLRPSVLTLQRIVGALLLVCFVLLSVAVFGWLLGVFIAVLVALEYVAIANLSFVRRLASRLYLRYESMILEVARKAVPLLKFFSLSTDTPNVATVHSREELVHLVSSLGAGVLKSDEKKLILSSLDFESHSVSEIMTPRSVINSVNSKEHLGPLVLDDLHKTGNSRFPVMEGDIDHIVGILHVRDLLTVDSKRKSTSVLKAMDPRVFYIREDQSLKHALAAFLRTHHHLFVVVNEFRETVGLLTLEDVLEALIGRKIIDEFDAHEDLRVVAARNPRDNNKGNGSVDV